MKPAPNREALVDLSAVPQGDAFDRMVHYLTTATMPRFARPYMPCRPSPSPFDPDAYTYTLADKRAA
ncbi:MAG: hypothetical protein KJ011_03285 [Burkholderiaceae bacterium]|nr:hypothetical protein [Burkholderiaceae bacterium]